MAQQYNMTGKNGFRKAGNIIRMPLVAIAIISLSAFLSDSEKDVRSIQTERTKLFARLFESGKIDSIFPLIEPGFLNMDTNIATDLSLAWRELQTVSSFRRTEIVNDFMFWSSRGGKNRCMLEYTDAGLPDSSSAYILQIVLTYNQSDSNAVIRNLECYNPAQDAALQQKRRIQKERTSYLKRTK
jgi:hypothetical protein